MDVLVLMETTGAAQKISIWKTFKMCFVLILMIRAYSS